MAHDKDKKASTKHHEHEAEAGLAGAATGAVVGSIAGPPGALAGAAIGAVVAAVTEAAAEKDAEAKAANDRELDRAIGVTGKEIGAPNLKHPAAKVGAYSAASSGAPSGDEDEESAEGPFEPPPEG